MRNCNKYAKLIHSFPPLCLSQGLDNLILTLSLACRDWVTLSGLLSRFLSPDTSHFLSSSSSFRKSNLCEPCSGWQIRLQTLPLQTSQYKIKPTCTDTQAYFIVHLLLRGPCFRRLCFAIEERAIPADLHLLLVGVVELHTLSHCLGVYLRINHNNNVAGERRSA